MSVSRWTEELTFQKLTEITKDEDIKQGLFPVPGLNPRNQGVPKVAGIGFYARNCFLAMRTIKAVLKCCGKKAH
jgi:hypothetical protein